MYSIENDFLKASFMKKGAELTGLYHKQLKLEYMWHGNPLFWSKQSPVLFPVVGGLKDNTYFYNNKPYQLPRHGFAREKDFSVVEQSAAGITFSLRYDEETLLVYPFQFELNIFYSLNKNTLTVGYEVKNLGNDEMYMSIGGHPAFKIPLLDDKYEDYFLEFNARETGNRWPVSSEGLIEKTPDPFFTNDSIIALTKELFLKDALVFKDLLSDTVSLKSANHEHGLDFHFAGFPFMGIWAAENADFVCIEPWCGIADSVATDQQLKNKEGINRVMTGEPFNKKWEVTVY